ncbi:GGDEF domain-containing protein [Catenovulum sp. SX2]|uniref:GGDEF domain-containing protein n=1 Tax=Catenovulum sp. SX2 TaxID=3398614 RepID=UPI003F84DEE1
MKLKPLKTQLKYLIVVYLTLILLCFSTYYVAVSIFVSKSFDSAEQDFKETSHAHYLHTVATLQKQIALLDGLSAYLDLTTEPNLSELKIYSDKILKRHPEVYQIQFAHLFPQQASQQVVSSYQQQNVAFKLTKFDMSTGIVEISEAQNLYIPITFTASRDKLAFSQIGLDLQSIPFIYEVIEQSLALENATTLSTPFESFEGNQVVVMLQQSPGALANQQIYFAFLIIDTNILLNESLYLQHPFDINIYLGHHNTESNLLVAKQHSEQSRFFINEYLPLPKFKYYEQLNLANRHVTFEFSHQAELTYTDSLVLLILTLFFILLLVLFSLMFFNQYKNEKERHQQAQKLYQLANFDSVTQLANRNYFFNTLSHSLNLASRHQDTILYLLYLDLDGFKAINDTIGHDAGDFILKQVANKLLQTTREGDTVARLGGDEFIILLENRKNHKDITPLISRISNSISNINQYRQYPIKLGVSIGLSSFPVDGETSTQLVNLADQRMYQDKRKRKQASKKRQQQPVLTPSTQPNKSKEMH